VRNNFDNFDFDWNRSNEKVLDDKSLDK
jgi:hypothetical protein